MAKKKKKKKTRSLPDIDVIFAVEELTDKFVTALHLQFPDCRFEQDGNLVSIWAPMKDLPLIRSLTEKSCFCRRSISLYTAF